MRASLLFRRVLWLLAIWAMSVGSLMVLSLCVRYFLRQATT